MPPNIVAERKSMTECISQLLIKSLNRAIDCKEQKDGGVEKKDDGVSVTGDEEIVIPVFDEEEDKKEPQVQPLAIYKIPSYGKIKWKTEKDRAKIRITFNDIDELALGLQENHNYHMISNPDSFVHLFGDIDVEKDKGVPTGVHIGSIKDWEVPFVTFVNSLDGMELKAEQIIYTKNTGLEGSYHWEIPFMKCRIDTLHRLVTAFSGAYEDCQIYKFIHDTSFYKRGLWRLPNQTTIDNYGNLKTKHEVISGELKQFFPQYIEGCIDVDAIINRGLDAREKVKKTNVEDLSKPEPEQKNEEEDEEPEEEEETNEIEEEIQPEHQELLEQKKIIEQEEELNLVKGFLEKCFPNEYFSVREKWINEIAIPMKRLCNADKQFTEKIYAIFDTISKSKCPQKYDPIENRRIWDSIGKCDNPKTIGSLFYIAKKYNREEYLKLIRNSKICSREKLRKIYENIDKSDLQEQSQDVFAELLTSFYKSVKLNSPKVFKEYSAFLDECVWTLNNYLCWIQGNEKGYVLHRETIEEDIPNLKGEIVHAKIPIFLGKCATNYEDDIGNYKIPDGICTSVDSKTKKVTYYFSPHMKSIFNVWLDSTQRRNKRRETFIKKGRDFFPVFDHIAITRELAQKHTGDFSTIQPYLKFQKEHFCGNNEKLLDYFLNWQAHLLQHPAEKMVVILVMRGLEGIGKGIFFGTLMNIIGEFFFLSPSSTEELFGNFNSLMDNKLLVIMDELFWGGDRQKNGILKKLASEITRTSNTKFGAQKTVENNINSIIASNDEWVIPAGQNARRFCMTEVDDWLTNQTQEIIDELRNVDRFTYAHYLYTRDLSNFNPRKCVLTSALAEQKRLSASPFMKYVIDKIDNKFTFEIEKDEVTPYGTKKVKVQKQLSKMLKLQFCEDYQKKTQHPLQFNPFIKKWLKLFPNSLSYGSGSKHKDWIIFPTILEAKKVINREFRQDMFEEPDMEDSENRDEEVERLGYEEYNAEIPDFEEEENVLNERGNLAGGQ
jgi:hypothetical protein